MTNQNLIIGFAALVVVLGAWTVYAGKGVPWHQSAQQKQQPSKRRGQQQHQDEAEGDPEDWSEPEMKAWLENRGETVDENEETRVMLLARIQEMRR